MLIKGARRETFKSDSISSNAPPDKKIIIISASSRPLIARGNHLCHTCGLASHAREGERMFQRNLTKSRKFARKSLQRESRESNFVIIVPHTISASLEEYNKCNIFIIFTLLNMCQ